MFDSIRYAIRYRSEWSRWDKTYWYGLFPVLSVLNLVFFIGGSILNGIVLVGFLAISAVTLAIKGSTMRTVHARKMMYAFKSKAYDYYMNTKEID